MKYISIQDCHKILFQIAIDFDISEDTPHYSVHKKGILELEGIFQRVQQSWYRGVLTKAAYLFVGINKGHFFPNGNKRLSLVIAIEFLYRNGFAKQKPIRKKTYAQWFGKHFPDYTLTHTQFPAVYEWAFYNLNKAVASDTKSSFDELKEKVEDFLRLALKHS